MTVSLVVSLAAALIATGAAAAIVAQGARQPVNRLAAILSGCVALWAISDLLRAAAPDAETARRLALAAVPTWVFIGPLGLHLFVTFVSQPPRLARRLLPCSYAVSAGFLALAWLTPWMYGPAGPGRWGWSVPPGPALSAVLIFTLANVLPAILAGLTRLARSASASDRAQLGWIAVGLAFPLVCTPLTNIWLPTLGYEPVRLGSLSFALFAAIIAWTSHRHGYSPLAHGSFSRRILDAHPDGVALVLLDGQIGTASQGLAELAGTPRAALVGRAVGELLDQPLVDPPREVQELDAVLRTDGGHGIPVSVSTRMLQDRQGLDFALVVVIRDLREVVALRSHLVTSGRLAAIGQLAAGIAHEINNPMAFVRTNLTLLRSHWDRLAKDPEAEAERRQLADECDELLDESLEGVDRACTIVRDINGFAHAGSGERTPLDLHQLLDNVLRVASPHLGRGLRVERRFAGIPFAIGAAQELKQVFLNLVLNAAQAAGDTGTIRIATEAEGDEVVVRLEDEGCGIPPDAIEKIFDPFFTTKPVGGGTGMGLFISYQIIRNHRGSIRVESEPGRGTRVTVRLPAQLE